MTAYLAMVKTPLGVWESTAVVCSGHEAEYRAKQGARIKFLSEILPPFMTRGLDGLVSSYWSAAQTNGCELIVREIDIEKSTDNR